MDVLPANVAELVVASAAFVPRLLTGIVGLLAALVLAKLAGRAVLRAVPQADAAVRRLLNRLTTIAIIVVGVVVALQQVDFDVSAFVAGLGLVGFTLGFAFRDIAKNFIAGVLLLIQQPFGIGDAIEVSGYEGRVTDVDIRATTIKGWDGQEIVVPNADVYTSPISN